MQLLIEPKLWKMWSKKSAYELYDILAHFTKFAPFKGRLFIRVWLEALTPCFCRWILLSNAAKEIRDEFLVPTLKNFLGSFGQPGIVACFADRGASMFETLKSVARAVEAVGRGAVELYFWKRIAESKFGGTNN